MSRAAAGSKKGQPDGKAPLEPKPAKDVEHQQRGAAKAAERKAAVAKPADTQKRPAASGRGATRDTAAAADGAAEAVPAAAVARGSSQASASRDGSALPFTPGGAQASKSSSADAGSSPPTLLRPAPPTGKRQSPRTTSKPASPADPHPIQGLTSTGSAKVADRRQSCVLQDKEERTYEDLVIVKQNAYRQFKQEWEKNPNPVKGEVKKYRLGCLENYSCNLAPYTPVLEGVGLLDPAPSTGCYAAWEAISDTFRRAKALVCNKDATGFTTLVNEQMPETLGLLTFTAAASGNYLFPPALDVYLLGCDIRRLLPPGSFLLLVRETSKADDHSKQTPHLQGLAVFPCKGDEAEGMAQEVYECMVQGLVKEGPLQFGIFCPTSSKGKLPVVRHYSGEAATNQLLIDNCLYALKCLPTDRKERRKVTTALVKVLAAGVDEAVIDELIKLRNKVEKNAAVYATALNVYKGANRYEVAKHVKSARGQAHALIIEREKAAEDVSFDELICQCKISAIGKKDNGKDSGKECTTDGTAKDKRAGEKDGKDGGTAAGKKVCEAGGKEEDGKVTSKGRKGKAAI